MEIQFCDAQKILERVPNFRQSVEQADLLRTPRFVKKNPGLLVNDDKG